MVNEKVSVVVAVDHRRDQLQTAIRSVIKQTYENWELIIVDDNASQLMDQIASDLDPRIKMLQLPFRGIASSLNAGLGNTNGEFISFLDPDAPWLPTKLLTQVELLSKLPDVALCYSDIDFAEQSKGDKSSASKSFLNIFDDAFETDVHELQTAQARVFKARDGDRDLAALAFLEAQCVNVSTAMIRRSCLPYTGLFDPMLGTGVFCDMWVKIMRRFCASQVCNSLVSDGSRISNTNAPTAVYAFDHAEIYSKYIRYGTATANPRLVSYATDLLSNSSHIMKCHNRG